MPLRILCSHYVMSLILNFNGCWGFTKICMTVLGHSRVVILKFRHCYIHVATRACEVGTILLPSDNLIAFSSSSSSSVGRVARSV